MSVDAKTVRHIAKLARIAVSDAEVDALAPELSNILGWIEQLGEVDVAGVEPMTAVIPNQLRLRDDVVTEGDIRDDILANAPVRRARLLRRPQGDRMSALTDLGVAAIRDGVAAGDFSAREVAEAYIANVEKGRPLNAFVVETPEHVLAAADAADAARASGDLKPLSGVPLGIKDLFSTKGVQTTAGSKILEGYKPVFESTVSGNLFAAGAGMLGKLNMDEFAMGSSNETSGYGPVLSPWRRSDGGNAALTPGGSSGGSAAAVAARLAPGVTGTDTGGSIRQPAAFTGITGIKPTYGRCSRYGIVAFASSLDQAGPMARDVRDCAILLEAMAGFDPKDSTSLEARCSRLGSQPRRRRARQTDRHSRRNIASTASRPRSTRSGSRGSAGCAMPAPRSSRSRCRTHSYALATYYIIAPAEASSNLARYDGVRYGLRVQPEQGNLQDMYEATRAAGFGPEVKRRIMIGTYVLSAGFYDAYFNQAQKVRALIARDFERGLAELRPAPHPDRAERRLRPRREDGRSDRHVSERCLRGPRQPRRPPRHLRPRRPRRAGPAARPAAHRQGARRAERAQRRHGLRGTRRLHPSRGGLVVSDYRIQGATGEWEVVIGLEVHAQVTSEAKLFSGASTEFGAEPNSHVALIDAAFPGMLPTPNVECIRQAVRTGMALDAKINAWSRFDRKNYFYADLPQGYQISQLYHPIVGEGAIEVELESGATKTIGVERIHIEQDAGKLMHDQHPNYSYVDLNRCGVALMEIVSRPDMRSPEEAGAYVRKLRAILRYVGSCDGNMEQGSMRADVNVSVRKPGDEFGTRTETKNVNSVRFIMQVIEHEARRQVELIEEGGTIVQETRLFDPDKGETRSLRSKEDAHDYRYFPDPDLLPLELDEAFLAECRASPPRAPGRQARPLRGRARPLRLQCRRAHRRRDHRAVVRSPAGDARAPNTPSAPPTG